MTRQTRLRALIFALVGVLVAICAGFVILPMSLPRPEPIKVVVMEDYSPTDKLRFQSTAPPPVVSQPLPETADFVPEQTEHWDRAHDRADWIGGATVTCDLAGLPGVDRDRAGGMVFMDMDQGVHLEGNVDVVSRFYTPVQQGRITFTVAREQGETRLLMPRNMGSDDPGRDPSSMQARSLTVRWSGAAEGSTVACDGVWEDPTGTLALVVLDENGRSFADGADFQQRAVVVRGCGVMLPVTGPVGSFLEVRAGRCALQIERRSTTFPLIVNRGDAIVVDVLPGQTTELTLRAPPEPPLYQPPDLIELSTAADVAGYFGADAVADAMDELLQRIANGEWDPQLFEEIAKAARGDDFTVTVEEEGPPARMTKEDWREVMEQEAAENPELIDELMVQDTELIDAFADDVAAGGSLEGFPPQTRDAIQAELARRRDP